MSGICLGAKKRMYLNMFGFLAALNSFVPKERHGREALIYENDIRSGGGLPRNRIYRESSVDRKARKELIGIRRKERIQQQMKLVRLMKKLFVQIEHSGEIDAECEQMREKITQIEMKIEKTARENEMKCNDMFDLDQPDDDYDIQLEQLVRRATLNEVDNFESKPVNEKPKDYTNASGDHADSSSTFVLKNNISESGDGSLVGHIEKAKCN